MRTFLQTCLYIFACFAALGLIPATIWAARTSQPALIAVAFLIAAFVIFVLVKAAAEVSK